MEREYCVYGTTIVNKRAMEVCNNETNAMTNNVMLSLSIDLLNLNANW